MNFIKATPAATANPILAGNTTLVAGNKTITNALIISQAVNFVAVTIRQDGSTESFIITIYPGYFTIYSTIPGSVRNVDWALFTKP